MSNKTKKARYVLNMNTGTWGFRTEMTDRMPLTFKLIDDETCKALVDGRITSRQVIEAIKKEIMSKSGFSWDEFDRQRQAEKLKLNISQHDMVPVGEDEQKDNGPSGPEEVVRLTDVLGGEGNGNVAAPNGCHASAEDNTNVGGVDGGDNFIPMDPPKAMRRKGGV